MVHIPETVVMEVIRIHVDSDAPEDAKEGAFIGQDWSFINLLHMANDFCAYVAKQLGLTILSMSHSYGEQYTTDDVLQHCYLSTCVIALNGVKPEIIKAFLDNDKEWEPYTQFDQGLFTVHLSPSEDRTDGRPALHIVNE